MLRFEHPYYLLFALLLIPAAWLLWVFVRWYRSTAHRLASPELLRRLLPDYSPELPLRRGAMVLGAALLLIIGLANPQLTSEPQKAKRKGLDMVLAVDVSQSMLAEDMKPSRLERAKETAIQLADKLGSDRIGLVVFAGEASVQSPLTSDHSGIKLFLQTLTPDMMGSQGTAIGQAIAQADQLLYPEGVQVNKAAARVIVLITDGEDHEEGAEQEAQSTAEKGTRIYTIGVGSRNGANIPIYRDGAPIGYLRDENGDVVVSKPNEELLQSLSEAGKGSYLHMDEGGHVVSDLVARLGTLQRAEQDDVIYTSVQSYFQYFVAAGLLLLLLEYFLFGLRRTKAR